MYFKNFDGFEPHEIEERKLKAVVGGEAGGGGDTGDTGPFIETTNGSSGLDNYPDPVYNDGTKRDWTDKDACK